MPYKDPETRREYMRQWRKLNPPNGNRQAYLKRWREENKDQLRQSASEWQQNNKVRKSASRRAWRERNSDKDKAQGRKDRAGYYQRHKAAISLKVRNRKQNLRTIDELGQNEWEAVVEACGNRCIVPGCGASPVTMDHVIPLSRGGRHHISNLQPLCGLCNDSKGVKITDYREG